MFKRMSLMLLAVLIVFGGIFGYKAIGNHFMNQFFDNMPMPTASITAAKAEPDRWEAAISAVGSFVAMQGTELTSESSGIVREILFESGAAVEKGQLLVKLDDSIDQPELARLQAAAKLAQIELNRNQRLFQERSVSELDLRRRESEAEQAAAAVRMQQARIAQKEIRAPFSGILGIRRVNLGQLLSPGSAVVSLEALDPVYLNFTLPEQRLSQIHLGQQVRVRVDAHQEQAFYGEITAISPGVRASSRSVEIQATLQNPDYQLRPGMFGRVEVLTGQVQDVLLVPQTAIQFNTFGNSVFVLREEDGQLKAFQRFVQTGETRGDLINVLSGLEPGDQVATSGLLKLRNGAAVKVSENGNAQPSAELNPQPANQ
ncbi:efflux RND transporter periplasmic adaptor subunit [Alkalimonas sp. MEB108]|uniref:Efflux RND transporter periplasmic adaptor subunit n=1 Tax=Alkalimonas cellulosilytica TaxID=3058395 RepID=A0ABU7J944_9GAMM|nr:efflux RND transporter periplasmic adaptor subunit [Alkalimonas sp. MEB108]MEE2002793.1 efflux RND transporter periplasmic adaptor subunit [Alkalimonas sp. MEB108]